MVSFNPPENTGGVGEQSYSHFREMEAKAQRSQIACPKSNKLKSGGITI